MRQLMVILLVVTIWGILFSGKSKEFDYWIGTYQTTSKTDNWIGVFVIKSPTREGAIKLRDAQIPFSEKEHKSSYVKNEMTALWKVNPETIIYDKK